MNNSAHTHDLDQLKLNLMVLKNKISLTQDFLKQVSIEADRLQEFIFDEEDRELDKIQIYFNKI